MNVPEARIIYHFVPETEKKQIQFKTLVWTNTNVNTKDISIKDISESEKPLKHKLKSIKDPLLPVSFRCCGSILVSHTRSVIILIINIF